MAEAASCIAMAPLQVQCHISATIDSSRRLRRRGRSIRRSEDRRESDRGAPQTAVSRSTQQAISLISLISF